ncbi:MAG: hypothetical protein VR74_00210 [Hyphomonas sp. BRH_c22]|uniref:hypothetical protein n=1 Tax=Hyphomonas sp. BRH_c22 TaxID=1629710 RepID=UPI0005F1B379|nr:hypothetical protein [Hyphomonas sp. BRH_c22]KJS39894.1 MAG: hypothetical protein VR74_00210 [Hyphomonas sp. BRH_c22]
MKYLIASVSTLMIAGCQAAPQAAVPAVASVAPQDGERIQVAGVDEEIVCRSMKVTGTRFAKRECKTVSAWVEYDKYTNQNAKESTDNFQRLNTGCSTTGTC